MSNIHATLHAIKEHSRQKGDVRLLSKLASMDRYHRNDTRDTRNAARTQVLHEFAIPTELIKRVKAFALHVVRDCDALVQTRDLHSTDLGSHDLDVYALYIINHVYAGCFGNGDYEEGFDMATRLRALISHPVRASAWKDLHPRILYAIAGSNANQIKYADALLGVMVINFVLQKVLASGHHHGISANNAAHREAYAKVHRATELAQVVRAGYVLQLMDFQISQGAAAAMTNFMIGARDQMALSLASTSMHGAGGTMTLVDALAAYQMNDPNILKATAISRKLSDMAKSNAGPSNTRRTVTVGMSLLHQLMRVFDGPLRATLSGAH